MINYTAVYTQKDVHHPHFINFFSKLSSNPMTNKSKTSEMDLLKYNESNHNSNYVYDHQSTALQHKQIDASKSHFENWKKERFWMIETMNSTT
ncbi:unnamed protein product [Schistosoma rodhaini]|uniref:Uncharacterized protein n=1 Tax=Schistosoma mansoni TaxID=6183 RepID=G4VL70_SCHMA|nr:hypothetical protein Smp_077740 [Schistosoma mansoni]CAH8633578.1 unnamed protein product [Schistosoma rodhaini]|eukprot:XP_018653464.1 hypothetical protein Smp_077740 [Schistosoma mansoni]